MGKFFGEKLREARKAKDLNGTYVAETGGVHHSNLSAIEAGRREPPDVMIEKLGESGILGVSTDELRAWRDLDLIGQEGVRRLKLYVADELGRVEAKPEPRGKVTREWFPEASHAPSDWELALINRSRDLDVDFPLVQERTFWDKPEQERMRAFIMLESLLNEVESHLPKPSVLLRTAN
jgi:transcriptional regulator with XRE-family HTH domain